MKRRKFLKSAGLGAGAAALGASTLAAPAIAQQTFRWKMLTTWPRNLPAIGVGAQRIADAITKMSDGRLTIKLYSAGELVPAFETFDAVRDGVAECCHDAPYYWIAKHGAVPFFLFGARRADAAGAQCLDVLWWRPGTVGRDVCRMGPAWFHGRHGAARIWAAGTPRRSIRSRIWMG